MSSIAGMPATKHGLVFDDHHFKVDGRYEKSPPSKYKAMYDYLPTEMVIDRKTERGTPPRQRAAAPSRARADDDRPPTRPSGGHLGQAHPDEALPVG